MRNARNGERYVRAVTLGDGCSLRYWTKGQWRPRVRFWHFSAEPAPTDGRIVKVMGDGVLVEFASAVNAVTCAVELQKRMAEANKELPEERRIVLRVGINLGDVVGFQARG
jgi:class 3 adenylate cyclase